MPVGSSSNFSVRPRRAGRPESCLPDDCADAAPSADARPTPSPLTQHMIVPYEPLDNALVEVEEELPQRRQRTPRVRFDPTPVSTLALRAFQLEGTDKMLSEVTAEEALAALKRQQQQRSDAKAAAKAAEEEAAMQEAATPRALPFSLPPRMDRPVEPTLCLTYSTGDSTISTCSEDVPLTTKATRSNKRRVFSASDDEHLCAVDHGAIDVVSEFSGIGALEHGL